MNKIIVFLLYPAISHYVMSFDFATDLHRRGLKVIFAGPPNKKIESAVMENGFEYEGIFLFREYAIKGCKGTVSAAIYNAFFSDLKLRLYKSFVKSDHDIYRLVEKHDSPFFVIDDLMPFYGFLCRKYKAKFLYINTKHSGYMRLNVAPINSSRSICDSKNRLVNFIDWSFYILQRKCTELIGRISLGGFTLYGIMRTQSDRYESYFNKHDLTNNYSFNLMIRDVPVLILGNKYLEYSRVKLKPYEHYVQYKTTTNKSKNLVDKPYYSFVPQLTSLISMDNNVNVVYICFGLTSRDIAGGDYLKICLKAIDSALTIVNTIVIVSINREFHEKIKTTFKSENLYLFKFVPQIDLLNYCSLMINHGGLNSIQECLFKAVPILSCPINKSAEHYTNSAKVAHHGIGRSINIRKVSKRRLISVIHDLLTNKKYKSRLNEMNDKIDRELNSNIIDNQNIMNKYFS